jgi:hypothetical protein
VAADDGEVVETAGTARPMELKPLGRIMEYKIIFPPTTGDVDELASKIIDYH